MSLGSRSRPGSGFRRRPGSAYSACGFHPNAEKALLEAAIVRRREMERQRVDYWSQVESYYDRVERTNGRYNTWTSEEVRESR